MPHPRKADLHFLSRLLLIGSEISSFFLYSPSSGYSFPPLHFPVFQLLIVPGLMGWCVCPTHPGDTDPLSLSLAPQPSTSREGSTMTGSCYSRLSNKAGNSLHHSVSLQFLLVNCLGVPGLTCDTWDLQSSLQLAGSLDEACEI